MNLHRGEVGAVLAGTERAFRLTFEGLAEVEAALGSGIVSVAERFRRHEMGTAEVAAILSAGLKGAGHVLDEAALKAAVMEMGFVTAAKLSGEILARGLGLEESRAGKATGEEAPASPGDA